MELSRSLQRFNRLPLLEKSLLLQAFALFLVARMGLRMFPFAKARVFMDSLRFRQIGVKSKAVPLKRLTWAMDTAQRYLPGTTCLMAALAGLTLLKWHGYEAQLQIGGKMEGGTFKAHAWLTWKEEIVLGGSEAEKYSVLPGIP